LAWHEKEIDMGEELSDSTVLDTEFDIVDEIMDTVKEIEGSLGSSEKEIVQEKIGYLKFLVNDLGDALSGEYENLRRRRFITKKTK